MKKQQAYTSRGKILLEKSLQGNKDYGQCHRIQTADNSALPQRSVCYSEGAFTITGDWLDPSLLGRS